MSDAHKTSPGDSHAGMATSQGSGSLSATSLSMAGQGSSYASASSVAPGVPGAPGSASSRQRFTGEELAIVLSHFDIGVIDTVQEFPRGSRKSPKLLLRADTGLYLLKRRARGRDDPFKVAFTHAIQLHLAEQGYKLPRLIGTRRDNNSMLQFRGAIYELFEYIKGVSYDNSLEATQEAGRALAQFHTLLHHYTPEYEPARGSYHAARSVAACMDQIPATLQHVDPATAQTQAAHIHHLPRFLHDSYKQAAAKVNEQGMPDWPMQVIHSDWHPGNMLFRGPKLVAVLDYDAARIKQRVIDLANGMLQFSILGGGDDPSQWPEFIDETRFRRFLLGYESVEYCTISKAELKTIPWLMIEALIAESVIPVAATGSFARMDGVGFLLMVERKVRWLQNNIDHLVQMLLE